MYFWICFILTGIFIMVFGITLFLLHYPILLLGIGTIVWLIWMIRKDREGKK